MLLLNRLPARSPFPLHRFDSAVFGISAVLLPAVSLIAMYIPASRAMRTTRCGLCERNSEQWKPEEHRLIQDWSKAMMADRDADLERRL